jgi:hypothetical protein
MQHALSTWVMSEHPNIDIHLRENVKYHKTLYVFFCHFYHAWVCYMSCPFHTYLINNSNKIVPIILIMKLCLVNLYINLLGFELFETGM